MAAIAADNWPAAEMRSALSDVLKGIQRQASATMTPIIISTRTNLNKAIRFTLLKRPPTRHKYKPGRVTQTGGPFKPSVGLSGRSESLISPSASNGHFLHQTKTRALKLAQPIPTRWTLNHPATPGKATLHPLRSQLSVGLIAVMVAKLSIAARADGEVLRRIF